MEIPICGLSLLLVAMVNVVGLTGHSFLYPVSLDTVEPEEKTYPVVSVQLDTYLFHRKKDTKTNRNVSFLLSFSL